MLNLAVAYVPALLGVKSDAEEGFLGKLVFWARQKIRYERALNSSTGSTTAISKTSTSPGSIFPRWPGAMRPVPSRSPVRTAERGLGAIEPRYERWSHQLCCIAA